LNEKIEDVCKQLVLDVTQCNLLAELMPKLCPPCKAGSTEHKERRKSKWQECITLRRKGQPFDPHAIKLLAQEYKAGKCP